MEFLLFSVFAVLVTGGALAVIFFGDGRRPRFDEGTLATTANGQPRMFTPGDKMYYILGPGRPDWDN